MSPNSQPEGQPLVFWLPADACYIPTLPSTSRECLFRQQPDDTAFQTDMWAAVNVLVKIYSGSLKAWKSSSLYESETTVLGSVRVQSRAGWSCGNTEEFGRIVGPMQVIKTWGEMEVQLHSFHTPAAFEGSGLGCFTARASSLDTH